MITTNEEAIISQLPRHHSPNPKEKKKDPNPIQSKKIIFDPTTSTWAKKRKTKESQFQLNTTTSSINKMTLLLSMAPSKVLPTILHRFHRSTSISMSLWSACLSLLLLPAPPTPQLLLLLLLSTMLRAIKPFQVLLLLFVLFELLGFSCFGFWSICVSWEWYFIEEKLVKTRCLVLITSCPILGFSLAQLIRVDFDHCFSFLNYWAFLVLDFEPLLKESIFVV